MLPRFRAAACHVSPVFLNARATTDKCISLINRASRASAQLVVFPESFIPAFPIWSALFAPTENHDFFRRMVEESVHVEGEEIKAIRHAARNAGIVVSIGISEGIKTATLFNSNLVIAADGEINVHHRKLVPTFFEKLTWSPGDGYGLKLTITPFGKIGALICGENTNPLARYALMALGEQVHISAWPAVWPTRRSKSKEGKENDFPNQNYDNVAANYIRSAAHCFEAKCFGVSCAGHFSTENMDEILRISGDASCLPTLQQTPRAATLFLGPTGSLHPSFTMDEHTGAVKVREMIQDEEDILYADMDLADCVEGKQYHDVAGGYQRLDVFDLRIDRSRRSPINTSRPKAIVHDQERIASESATMFTPDDGGASFAELGAPMPLEHSLRSQNKDTSLNDEDAANKYWRRTKSSPTRFEETDSSLDQAQLLQGTKKQEATSSEGLGAGSESKALKSRDTFQPEEKEPLKYRYIFQPDERD